MKLFNISIPEALFLLVVMVIFLGPDQIVTFAGKSGRFLRKLTNSEIWKTIWQTSRDIRNLPNTLAQETGLDNDMQEVKKAASALKTELADSDYGIKQSDPMIQKTKPGPVKQPGIVPADEIPTLKKNQN